MRTAGSLLVLLTPFFATAGFFVEPWLTELARPHTRAAVYACFVGMLLHLICWRRGEA